MVDVRQGFTGWLRLLACVVWAGALAACAEQTQHSRGPSLTNETTVESVVTANSTGTPQDHYDTRCAHCHDGTVPRAPHDIEFQVIGRAAIYQTLSDGLMKVHTGGLDNADIEALADHLAGTVPASVPLKRCESNTIEQASAEHEGWSLTLEGTRFVPTSASGITRNNVADLKLRWVFAYPGATRARSQPAIYGDHILVGSQDGTVYALAQDSGCVTWTFKADIEVRSALTFSKDGTRAFFGDIKGAVYALDPRTGQLHWKTQAHDHPDVTLTGSPRYYNDRLYVPLSSKEWASAANPGYACCTFRGGVVSLDAQTGAIEWTGYAIADPATPTGEKNDFGVDRLHPAGAPIWNTPTIDVERQRLYVGTGEGYTSPAVDTSDSVVAFDLATGKRAWHYQSIAGDAWNMACFIDARTNCPVEDGPDMDIGAPPILVKRVTGDLLLAGQKSGHVFALHADTGELVWREKYGRGGFAGGVHWGMATNGTQVYAPNADTVFTGRFTGERKPGLFGININDGAINWFTPAPDVCKEADKPACDPGLSAAVTATDEVVFAGAFDGHLRAYDTQQGKTLWDFDTNREFESVSGELARGGSIDSDGPVLHQGMVLVNSGYLFGSRMAGNALLLFAVE